MGQVDVFEFIAKTLYHFLFAHVHPASAPCHFFPSSGRGAAEIFPIDVIHWRSFDVLFGLLAVHLKALLAITVNVRGFLGSFLLLHAFVNGFNALCLKAHPIHTPAWQQPIHHGQLNGLVKVVVVVDFILKRTFQNHRCCPSHRVFIFPSALNLGAGCTSVQCRKNGLNV